MKGFLAALLICVTAGLANAQQSQSDFTPPTVGSQRNGQTAPRTNRTRLAALQSDSKSTDQDSSRYVVMDDSVDFTRDTTDSRATSAPSRSTSFDRGSRETTLNRGVDVSRGSEVNRGFDGGRTVSTDRSSVGQRPVYGPENDPRIRNAVQEQPRYTGQSSDRSVTSVLPNRRGTQPNERYATAQTPTFSIYDLQITPDLEYQLKNQGFLYAATDVQQARSDQIRLFADRQLTENRDRESKIFASRVDTYQGNVVIDIDDYALDQIANGAYTLDDFDQYDARGVVLRYVDRDNRKVDITRLTLGQSNSGSSAVRDTRNTSSTVNSDPYRDRTDRFDRSARNTRGGQDDGHFVLPNSDRDSQRDTQLARDRTTRTVRDDRLDPYDSSDIRRNYQQRMTDIYRDDRSDSRTRVVDLRDERRYDDVRYDDDEQPLRRRVY